MNKFVFILNKFVDPPAKVLYNNQKALKIVLGRLYGHLLFGATQENPKKYFDTYKISMDVNLLKDFKPLILNKPDEYENSIITYFYPDDQNVNWTYNEDNLQIEILEKKYISGVFIDRSLNHAKEHYSKIEGKDSTKYVLSAKHLIQEQSPRSINQYKVRFVSNRFLMEPGQQKEGFQQHDLQIEEIAKFKVFDKVSQFVITDIDNHLKGNEFIN